MQIGEKLKQKRNEAGFSQEVLAEKIGVSRQTVSNWETNRSYPDIASVLRLSDLYGISLDELLKEDTNMRKHVEETAKLPLRWWNFLCGLTIALIPISALLHYWGAASAATVIKTLCLIFIPVLIFTRWKFTGGEKKELYIILGLYGFLLVGEILHQGGSFWTGAIDIWLVMAFVLIYGYGHYLGKGLTYWLLIFLYFGTPIYIAVEPNLSVFQSYGQASQAQLYGTYVVEESLQGPDSSGSQVSVFSDDTMTINNEYVGHVQYTKPLENQPHLSAVWQLVPANAPDTLYRLEVDAGMNKILSCIVEDQLQWKWLLGNLPEVKCIEGNWKETGGYPIRWYSEAEPMEEDDRAYPIVMIEPDTLFLCWGDESVTTLTVEETIGDGEPVLRTLHRDADGNFPLGEIFPESGVIHTYRIEYLGGAFVLRVKSLP